MIYALVYRLGKVALFLDSVDEQPPIRVRERRDGLRDVPPLRTVDCSTILVFEMETLLDFSVDQPLKVLATLGQLPSFHALASKAVLETPHVVVGVSSSLL